MAKIPECELCRFYVHSAYMVCVMHPEGPDTIICHHYAFEPCAVQKDEPNPLSWHTDDGRSAWQATYLGEPIAQPQRSLGMDEQLALLDTHPIFTGQCPECEIPMLQTEPPRVHWDCESCGWKDDSV